MPARLQSDCCGSMNSIAPPSPARACPSPATVRKQMTVNALFSGEPPAQDFVDYFRITFTAHRLHHLTDKKAKQLVAARTILGNFARFCGNYLVACCHDFSLVRNLAKTHF